MLPLVWAEPHKHTSVNLPMPGLPPWHNPLLRPLTPAIPVHISCSYQSLSLSFRSASTHAVTQQRAGWRPAHNVTRETAATTSVASRARTPCAELLSGSATLRTRVMEPTQTAQRTYTFKTGLFVTMTTTIALRESVKVTMLSAKPISKLVRTYIGGKMPLCICVNLHCR